MGRNFNDKDVKSWIATILANLACKQVQSRLIELGVLANDRYLMKIQVKQHNTYGEGYFLQKPWKMPGDEFNGFAARAFDASFGTKVSPSELRLPRRDIS